MGPFFTSGFTWGRFLYRHRGLKFRCYSGVKIYLSPRWCQPERLLTSSGSFKKVGGYNGIDFYFCPVSKCSAILKKMVCLDTVWMVTLSATCCEIEALDSDSHLNPKTHTTSAKTIAAVHDSSLSEKSNDLFMTISTIRRNMLVSDPLLLSIPDSFPIRILFVRNNCVFDRWSGVFQIGHSSVVSPCKHRPKSALCHECPDVHNLFSQNHWWNLLKSDFAPILKWTVALSIIWKIR